MSKKVEENKKAKAFPYVGIAVAVFFFAFMYMFYRYNKMTLEKAIDLSSCKINKTIGKIEGQVDSLKNDVLRLDRQIESAPANKNTEILSDNRSQLRKKWKTWMALRCKMEANEVFEEELKAFNELFACDKELIDLVGNLAKGIEVITNGNEGKIMGACKTILRKIIKLKKINQRRLAEISGYVLSSIDNCN